MKLKGQQKAYKIAMNTDTIKQINVQLQLIHCRQSLTFYQLCTCNKCPFNAE